jgi:drug/metabolite transporter (DMT)-like permease
MPHLLFILICCLWGTSFVLMKQAMADDAFGYVGVGAARVVFGAIALWVIWRAKRKPWPLKRKDMPLLLLIAVMGFAIPYSLQPLVIRLVDNVAQHGSAFGGMMVSFVPLLTILVSIPMLRVLPTRRQLIGVLGGIFCIYLLYAAELHAGVPLRYLFLGAITPTVYAFSNTLVKKRFSEVPPIALVVTEMSLCACLLVPLAAVRGDVNPSSGNFPLAVVCLVILGVLCTGIATAMFYTLIQGHGPLYAGMVTYIIPCISMLVGHLVGETITMRQVGAMVGILLMVALVQSGVPTKPFKPDVIEP